jgi:hypothetical protein
MAPSGIFCLAKQPGEPIKLDFMGIFHEEFHLMDPLFHQPGKNRIYKRHDSIVDQESKIQYMTDTGINDILF